MTARRVRVPPLVIGNWSLAIRSSAHLKHYFTSASHPILGCYSLLEGHAETARGADRRANPLDRVMMIKMAIVNR